MNKLMLLVAAALTLAAVPSVAPAADGGTVTVHLDVDLAFQAVEVAACDVDVAVGGDGVAVLDAAVASGCIDSYEVESHSFGDLVACINDICQTPAETSNAVFWAIYLDGASAPAGVRDLAFTESGHALGFSYQPWAQCLVGVCP